MELFDFLDDLVDDDVDDDDDSVHDDVVSDEEGCSFLFASLIDGIVEWDEEVVMGGRVLEAESRTAP